MTDHPKTTVRPGAIDFTKPIETCGDDHVWQYEPRGCPTPGACSCILDIKSVVDQPYDGHAVWHEHAFPSTGDNFPVCESSETDLG